MRFEMVQCDAFLKDCACQTELDNSGEWLENPGWQDDYGNALQDVCPSCADRLAVEAEHDLTDRETTR